MKRILIGLFLLSFSIFGDVNDDLIEGIQNKDILTVKKNYRMGATVSFVALKEAFLSKNEEIVSFLLSDKENKKLLSPGFFNTIANEDLDSLRLLIKFYPFKNPSNIAIIKKDMVSLEKLFLKKPYNRYYLSGFNNDIEQEIYPLSLAIVLGYRDFVDFLIKKGAEPVFYDYPHFEDNENLGSFSGSRYVLSTFWLAIKAKNYEFLKFLISKGANINVYNEGDGIDTPLRYAIENDDEELAKILIDNGAFTNIKTEPPQYQGDSFWGTSEDYSPIFESYLTVALQKNNKNIVDLLMSKNTKVEATDVEVALENQNIDFIIKYGKNVPISDKFLYQLINDPSGISVSDIATQSQENLEKYLLIVLKNCNDEKIRDYVIQMYKNDNTWFLNVLDRLREYNHKNIAQKIVDNFITVDFLFNNYSYLSDSKDNLDKSLNISSKKMDELIDYLNEISKSNSKEDLKRYNELLENMLFSLVESDTKEHFTKLFSSKLVSEEMIKKLYLYSILTNRIYYFEYLKKYNPVLDNDYIINNFFDLVKDSPEALKNLKNFGFILSSESNNKSTLLSKALDVEHIGSNFTYDTPEFLEFAKILLDSGINPDKCGYKGNSSIFKTIGFYNINSFEFLKLLRQYKADFKLLDSDGNSILIKTLKRGDLKMASYIIEEEPSLITLKNSNGISPLSIAAYNNFYDIVSQMVLYHPNLNVLEESNNTPLLDSICNFSYESAKLLIETGADVNIKNLEGISPIIEASYLGQDSIIDLLIKYGANIDDTSKNGISPLMAASMTNKVNTVDKLLKYGANLEQKSDNGYTALLYATSNENIDVSEYLINHGANILAEANKGWTPLKQIICKDYLSLLKLVLKKGIKINLKEPILAQIASYWNSVNILDYLIKSKIDLNLLDLEGNSLLMLAAKNNSLGTAQLLIKKGANKKIRNYKGQGILEIAGTPETRKYLMDLGVTW